MFLFYGRVMKILFLWVLMMVPGALFAQQDGAEDENENKKKPSWSTGLPERTAAPTLNKPSTNLGKPSFDVADPVKTELPSADVSFNNELSEGLKLSEIDLGSPLPVAKPQINQEDNNVVSFDSSPEVREEQQAAEPVIEPALVTESENIIAVAEQPAILNAGNHVNRNKSSYDWEILKMEPVKIPRSMSYSYQEVTLEVHINPQGEVVKVKRLNDLTSNKLLNYSTKAMKNWQFKAPADYGINEVISTALVVKLEPR